MEYYRHVWPPSKTSHKVDIDWWFREMIGACDKILASEVYSEQERQAQNRVHELCSLHDRCCNCPSSCSRGVMDCVMDHNGKEDRDSYAYRLIAILANERNKILRRTDDA